MNKLEHVVGKNGNPSRPQAAMQEMDMLEPCALEALFLELGTPDAGRRLIVKARQQAPVRQVRSTGKNVITFLASRKMGREIATESRTVEYIAALVSTSV